MKKQSKCDCKRSKHQINEYTLISSDRTEPMCWVLEDVDIIPYNILENESNINPSSLFKKLIIDMKHEYDTKTKEELVSTLAEELIDNQTKFQASRNLSVKLKSFKITSISDAFESSSDHEKEEVLWDKNEESKDRGYAEDKNEHLHFTSSQIKNSILNRHNYERMTKEQKSYIMILLKDSNMSISEVTDKIMVRYSTVYSIKRDFEWYKDHNLAPFSDIQQKKRTPKVSTKYIKEFVSKQKESFTIRDIKKAVKIHKNEDIKEYIIRNYLKTNLKMSYKKWTNKPWNVDVSKLSILRYLFSYRIGKQLLGSSLMVSLDETAFNHKVANSKWWIKRGYSTELFTSNFIGNWSLIIAITNEGSYFGVIVSGKVNSSIYLRFLMNLEKWIETKRSWSSQEVVILKDNWQIHRSKLVWSFMERSQFTYVFIPTCTPKYSPVEKVFAILKSKCRSHQSQKSINWERKKDSM